MIPYNTINNISAQWLSPSLDLPEYWRSKAFRLSPRWQMGIALMLNLLSLALPIMMLQVYDRIIPHQAYGTLAMLIIGVGTALVFESILRSARAWLTGWTAASNEHAGTCAAMERFMETDLTGFEASGPGTHMQRLGAIARLREFYSGQALTAVIDLPFAAVFLFMIAYLGGWLVIAPLILLIFFCVTAFHAGTLLKNRLEGRAKSDDRKASFLIETLTGIHSIKAMSMEKQMLRQFEEHQTDITRASYRVARATGIAAILSTAFSQLSQIVTAIAGCLLVLNEDLSMGSLSACTLLAGRALQPVQRVMGTWLRLQDFAVARTQASAIFSMPALPREKSKLDIPEGKISVQDVSFGYTPGSMLFKNVSFEAEFGDVIAISGSKGAGKSTLLQVLAGVLAPTTGIVRIDNIDPSKHGMASLASHIGYLPQQGTIFKGTILENLTGFQEREDYVAIAKHMGRELGLDSVVDLLPKGYATMLEGTPADPVPPGIKQRIALARVLKNMPAILLFDDADRTLDKEGYNRLFKLIGRFKGMRTIIMISHDQNLLSFADHFYHLENGTLTKVEEGAVQHLSLLTSKKADNQ